MKIPPKISAIVGVVAVFLAVFAAYAAGEESTAKIDTGVVNLSPVVVEPMWFQFGIVVQNNGKPSGILIKNVTPGSKASKVGLKNDMEVLSINGVAVEEVINTNEFSTEELRGALTYLDSHNEKIVMVVKGTGVFGRIKTIEVPARGVLKGAKPKG